MRLRLPPLGGTQVSKSIGLDIGFHTLKAVELVANAAGGFEITNFAVKEIPKDLGDKTARAENLGKLIRQMFDESKIEGDQVYISVSGHNVVIRKTQLPKMPREELIDATRWNSKEEVLFSVDDAAIGCHILGEVIQEGVTFYNLLTVIVRADIIPFLVAIVKHAGLKPVGVTIIPMALWDYDRAINKPGPDVITSYVDMGAERTRIYFVSGNDLMFSREIPNGGKHITAALAGQYTVDKTTVNVDEVRAEALKRTYGLPAENALDKTPEGIPLKEIRARVLPIVTKQTEEFHRSLEYFKNQYKKDKVHRMIMSGGGVSLKGLYQFLASHLDVEIERCNALLQSSVPVKNVPQDTVKLLGPSLTTAAGLALGRCDKINVLPEEFRYSLRKTLIAWAPLLPLPLVLIGMLLFSQSLRADVAAKTKQLEENQRKLEILQSQLPEAQLPLQQLEQIKKAVAQLQKEKSDLPEAGNPVDLQAVLDELAKAIPQNAAFAKIAYTFKGDKTGGKDARKKEEKPGGEDENDHRTQIYVRGEIFGNEQEVLASLTLLLEQLKNAPLFAEIKLVKSEATPPELYNQPGLSFELSVYPATGRPAPSLPSPQ
jgi:type IV pilus assembly protein PilM